MLTRRKFFVFGAASSAALALQLPRIATATTGNWSQQEGGWKDLDTGLVWLDYTLVGGSLWSYPRAVTEAANYVSPAPGLYDDWRLPTLAEMQTAVLHGAVWNMPLTNANPSGDEPAIWA